MTEKTKREMKKNSSNSKRNTKSKKGYLKDNNNKDDIEEAVTKRDAESRNALEQASAANGSRNRDLFNRWLVKTTENTPRAIYKEFNDNKTIAPPEYTTEACRKNDAKNRYNDILCIDKTRVKLQGRPPDDDYIHASWMTMPDLSKFISTQGPTHDTFEDFWHMLFTEKSNVIVMVCGWREYNVTKCARYYPKTTATVDSFGPYKVSWKDDRPDPYEDIKHNVIEVDNGSEKMIVHHLANLKWTDHIAPERPTATLGMLKLAKTLAEGNPITVHCSAGIGRTCTFIGIEYAYQRAKQNPDVTSLEILRELRAQRFHAVQSPIQYSFMHACVVEMFLQEKDALPFKKGKQFLDNYQRMVKRYIVLSAKKKAAEKIEE